MNIQVIILHYGKTSVIERCIASILGQVDSTNVTIVNNNAELLHLKNKEHLHIINTQENKGYAGGMNTGIKHALQSSFDYLLLITNDMTFENDFIAKLKKHVEESKADIGGFIVLNEKGNVWFDGGEIDTNRYSAGHLKNKTDYISGCCMLIKKDVFNEIGMFDENFFMYYEDADFCIRARRAGFHINIDTALTAYHNTAHSPQATKNMQYYLARNHLYFLKKHAPIHIKLREYIRLPKTILEHISKKEVDALQGLFDGLIGKLGKRI